MRRFGAIIIVVILVLFQGIPPGNASDFETEYNKGMAVLNSGDFQTAASIFERLGYYKDSSKLTVYCKALEAANNKQFSIAIPSFVSLGDFKDSSLLAIYYQANLLEEEGETSEAIELYETIPLFRDSISRIENLKTNKEYYLELGALRNAKMVFSFHNGLARFVSNDDLYGFINTKGEVVVQPAWDFASDYREEMILVKKNNRLAVLNSKGETIVPLKYDWLDAYEYSWFNHMQKNGMLKIVFEGKWGIANKQGVVLEPVWDKIGDFEEGLAPIKRGEKWGFVDTAGKVVEAFVWDDATSFKEGFAFVKFNHLWGLLDSGLRLICEQRWEEVRDFSEGLAAVAKDGLYGFIDSTGVYVIQPKWMKAGKFRNGFSVIGLDGLAGVIDREGKTIIEPVWETVEHLVGNYFMTEKDGKKGIINSSGVIIIPHHYDKIIWSNPEEPIKVRQYGKWGYIDKENRTVMTTEWDNIEGFFNGLSVLRKIDSRNHTVQSLVIDVSGNRIEKPNWHYISSFRGRFAFVSEIDFEWIRIQIAERNSPAHVKSKSGIINTQGKVVIPLEWEFGDDVGLHHDMIDERTVYMSVYFNSELFKDEYNDFYKEIFDDGVIPAKKEGVWYLIDLSKLY